MSKQKSGRPSRASTPAGGLRSLLRTANSKQSKGTKGTGGKGKGTKGPSRRWGPPSAAAVRETVESVVIAFVLAFLFRTFEAEAFVIPTGSMAPTLMGRHKDVTCPICGHEFRVSASDEVDPNTGASRGPLSYVVAGTCPICRYTMDLGPNNPQDENYPSFKGDRILVGKFAYQFSDPDRWDVAVFKYPEDADTNFIKRLVGLPNERLRISRGDIYTAPPGLPGAEPDWTIERKPPKKLLAMVQPVFDNDCIAAMLEKGWGEVRWRQHGGPPGAWEFEDQQRAFATEGTAEEVWVRYEHRVPSYEQWVQCLNQGVQTYDRLVPHLISDFCAYNTGVSRAELDGREPLGYDVFGLNWVGDLMLECRADVRSESGEVVFELVEGGRRAQCRVDVATGEARLTIDGQGLVNGGGEPAVPTAKTDMAGPGSYDVRFSNCDKELLFWVDGGLVEFDAPTTYDPLGNTRPTVDDLAPVGIASRGTAVKLSGLKIYRDVYYTSGQLHVPYRGLMTDFRDPGVLHRVLVDSTLWQDAFKEMPPLERTLEKDQFLALGDNSTKSKDSRLWTSQHFVSRDLLIGKALFIYWPHSWDELPGTGIPFPFFPNFPRMGFVR